MRLSKVTDNKNTEAFIKNAKLTDNTTKIPKSK